MVRRPPSTTRTETLFPYTTLFRSKKEDILRAIVDNVGKRGTAGQTVQNIISVAMLSEGWDAKHVTHIMGMRALTSQLLIEMVLGRGLRRVSYMTDEKDLYRSEERRVSKERVRQYSVGGAPND